MKTKLIIDEDLKGYLVTENNRGTENNFNMQWIFKFDNNYGASVIKDIRKLWF